MEEKKINFTAQIEMSNQFFFSGKILYLDDYKLTEIQKVVENHRNKEFSSIFQTITKNDNQSSVTMTLRRGTVIDKNIQQNKIYIKQDQINYGLKANLLSRSDLRKVINFLQEKNMILSSYINSGGEADVYSGYTMNDEGQKSELAFRMIITKQKQSVLEEFKKVTSINNPQNLIQYLTHFEIDNIVVFIMKKYCGSLKDNMKKKLTNHEFLNIALDLFEGLIELRVNNIIHSDIKPDNILIDENFKCFYSDFGMSQKLNLRQGQSEILGYTQKYCSPEHLSKIPISYASDMYSLGKVMLEISKQLEDQEFKDLVEQFLNDKLLQIVPCKRISFEELIPQFAVATSFNYDRDIIKKYIFKIKKSIYINQFEKGENIFVNLKINLSNKVLMIILLYILMNKSYGIEYNSLTNNKFRGLNTFYISKLLYSIACLPGNLLTSIQKKRFLKNSLQMIQQMNSTTQSNVLKANILFLIGQLALNNEKFVKAEKYLSEALKLAEDINCNDNSMQWRLKLYLGKIFYCSNKISQAQDLFKECGELFLYETKDKYQEIKDQFLFAQTLEECGSKEQSNKYYNQITTFWEKSDEILKRIAQDQQIQIFRFISKSYKNQNDYDQFLKVHILFLYKIFEQEENLTIFELEMKNFFLILMESKPENLENQFQEVNKKYENSFFKKILMIGFVQAFDLNQNDKLKKEAMDVYESISEKIENKMILSQMFSFKDSKYNVDTNYLTQSFKQSFEMMETLENEIPVNQYIHLNKLKQLIKALPQLLTSQNRIEENTKFINNFEEMFIYESLPEKIKFFVQDLIKYCRQAILISSKYNFSQLESINQIDYADLVSLNIENFPNYKNLIDEMEQQDNKEKGFLNDFSFLAKNYLMQ